MGAPLHTIAAIQVAVAIHYGIPLEAMMSDQRHQCWSRPRQMAMFLSREITHKSLPCIAGRFHRHHTTVMHAIEAIEKRSQTDPTTAGDLELLRERLGQ